MNVIETKEDQAGASTRGEPDADGRSCSILGFPVGFWETDVAGNIVAVNDELLAILGQPREVLVGRRIGQFVRASVPQMDAEPIHAPTRCFRALLTLEGGERRLVHCAAAIRPLFADGEPRGSQALIFPIESRAGASERSEQPERRSILEEILQLLDQLCRLYQRLDEQEHSPGLTGVSDIPSLAKLTARERGVVRELAAGYAIKEVAHRLGISVHTTRNHLKSVFRKLGVRSQVELLVKIRGLRV